MSEGLLIKQEKYLETGIHIGTKIKTIDMAKFIYRTRNDGLFVLDLRAVDERIRMAGKVLSKYQPEEIVVIASRTYSSLAAKAFEKLTGVKVISGRFVPGVFTNVARKDFIEPKLVFICDPKGERQAVVECGKMGITTVGLCDTDNVTMFIDWVIPCNNKGRRALALIFWLLAREMAVSSGKVSSYDEFTPDFEAFEALGQTLAQEAAAPAVEESSEQSEEPSGPESSEEAPEPESSEPQPKSEAEKKPAAKKRKATAKKKPVEKKTAKKEESDSSDGASGSEEESTESSDSDSEGTA